MEEITLPIDVEAFNRLAIGSSGESYLVQVGTFPVPGRWFVVSVTANGRDEYTVTLRRDVEITR